MEEQITKFKSAKKLELFKKVLEQFDTEVVNGEIKHVLKSDVHKLFIFIENGLKEIEEKANA